MGLRNAGDGRYGNLLYLPSTVRRLSIAATWTDLHRVGRDRIPPYCHPKRAISSASPHVDLKNLPAGQSLPISNIHTPINPACNSLTIARPSDDFENLLDGVKNRIYNNQTNFIITILIPTHIYVQKERQMSKKTVLILAIVILATLTIGVISVSAASDMTGLTIKNRTDSVVWVSLLSPDNVYVYWLEVPAGETMSYTVPRAIYSHITVACGETATGSVDIRKLTTLVFTHCDGKPPNAGERSIEKVHLYDSPDRVDFNYQFD